MVRPEVEFYLTARNADPDLPLRSPVGRSGRAETSRQAYSIDAVNEFDPLFEDIYDYCELMALDVDTLIHEIGAKPDRHGFSQRRAAGHGRPPVLLQAPAAEAALKHDMYATFMAKPLADEPGSAMHVHQSVFDARTGANLFSQPDGSAAPAFYHFIGGLQRYMPAKPWRWPRPMSIPTAALCATPPRPSMCNGAGTTAPRVSGCRKRRRTSVTWKTA
ncbi:hypothetical protein LP420_03470 [Massilia sp. B-10]|nr:hypothetical protein LP420_03470 [Massilia sp. B-10]